MGTSPNGMKQKTYYVREDLARIMAMLASRSGKKESELVSEALDYFIKQVLNEEEMRVFGYKSGDENERNGSSVVNTAARDNGTDARRGRKSAVAQPIPKKRARKATTS